MAASHSKLTAVRSSGGKLEARLSTALSKQQGHPVVQNTKSGVFMANHQVSQNGSMSCAH